jgi:hypothetical protein
METFTQPRPFMDNPRFLQERKLVLEDLRIDDIDEPIRDIIININKKPFCFTLQCCYGHFVWDDRQDSHNLEPVPDSFSGKIKYRIAYLAVCIENSPDGAVFRETLARVADIDPEFVQFGSADWFWERHLNSYALQVEPLRFQNQDEAWVDGEEAQKLEKVRTIFFDILRVLQTL